MTDVRKLAEEALAYDAVATPGPWLFIPGGFRAGGHILTASPEEEDWRGHPLIISHYFYPNDAVDYAFISAARTREPILARAVLTLTAEVETARKVIAAAADWCHQWKLAPLTEDPAAAALVESLRACGK